MNEGGWRWSGVITEPAGLYCEVAAQTDRGLARTRNEDAVVVGGSSFLVADGMGGYDAGDRASHAVVSAFQSELPPSDPATLEQVQIALDHARAGVAAVAAETERGAGSTVSGILLVSVEGVLQWLLLNIGDSRVYQHVGSELTQLTVDHSLWEEENARRQPGDTSPMPARNVITRAVGAAESEPDTWLMPLASGVRYLICTDGLHGLVSDERIRAVLTVAGRPESAAAELIRSANEAGGKDNITVIVLDVLRVMDSAQSRSVFAEDPFPFDLSETVTATIRTGRNS